MPRLFPRPDQLTPPTPQTTQPPTRPKPLNTLIASARRLTTSTQKTARPSSEEWQEDAWAMYDLVGEQRFLANTLASRCSQARLYVGRSSDDPTGDPVPLDPTSTGHESDQTVIDAFDWFGGGASGRSAIINRLAINLFVAGDAWVVGIPPNLVPEHLRPLTTESKVDGEFDADADEGMLTSLGSLDWRALSVSEVTLSSEDEYVIHLGADKSEKIEVSPDDVVLIRSWRPHPRRAWQADSPTRSSLGVLRELVGLTMHIGAQIDSRLAGAGLLIVPQSASDAIKQSQVNPDDDSDDENDDPFTEALIEAMMTPIQDRSSASAVVPLVVTVPDDSTEKFRHITFSTPLDSDAREDRNEAIRRLALGQDAPPELLLGTGGMNHWGAWLVREDVVTTHIEPPLALICDAITTQYLWPTLQELGFSEEESSKYVVWYDVSRMIVRPNRASDAQSLYDRGVLSDTALRDSMGFSEDDAPNVDGEPMPQALTLALDLVKSSPALVVSPGLTILVDQIQAALDQTPVQAPDSEPEVDETITSGNKASKTDAESDIAPDTETTVQPTDQPPPALSASVWRNRV